MKRNSSKRHALFVFDLIAPFGARLTGVIVISFGRKAPALPE
jgi:hypothetical protein